jgi:hypothetical protein
MSLQRVQTQANVMCVYRSGLALVLGCLVLSLWLLEISELKQARGLGCGGKVFSVP